MAEDRTERKPEQRWSDPRAGRRYTGERWANARRAARDPRLVERILRRHDLSGAAVLDAPCGTGRLRPTIQACAGSYVGLDVSPPMLAEAQSGGARRLLLAELAHLPVADASFEAVVCCRILHHVADLGELGAIVRELVRVSSHLVVASFWDRGSLPALRRRLGWRDLGVRVAHSKDDVRRVFAAAGARVTGFEHSFRWLSQQTFAVAEKVR